MKVKLFQRGFNYSQDGAGNRLVIHLQGCNMRCPWCANPEGISPAGTLMVHRELLTDNSCPRGAAANGTLDRKVCGTCDTKECLSTFRGKAISYPVEEWETGALMEEIRRCAPLFFDGGGVTLSGGEPTLQFDACVELLSMCRANGINTAMETNGTHPRLEALFPLLDQLIMDCKHDDDGRHRLVTGIGTEEIKRNLRRAGEYHPDLLVRIPLIHGFNDTEENADGFVSLFRELKTEHVRFECLRYHEFGKKKWEECGMKYRVENGFVTDQAYDRFTGILKGAGLTLVRT